MIEPARMRAPAPIRVSPATPARPDGYPSSTPGSMLAPAPSRTSTAPGTSHFNGLSFRAHRCGDGHQRANDADSEASLRKRRLSGDDRVHEVGALVLQGLARLHLRADDVAVADQQLELAERVGDRLGRGHTALEHADAFDIVQVVEYHAAAAADRDYLAHLVGI